MSDYFVQSGKLRELRNTLDNLPDLAEHLGRPVQVGLVVDSNIIIQDIRWLVHVRKNKDAQSNLQEVIAAGTIELNAPMQLVDEVEEHLPRIAAQENINLADMMTEWQHYRAQIRFVEVPHEKLYTPCMGDDEKDIPFVVLQEMLETSGILSQDTDIARMSAKAVNIDVVLSLRDYSRASAIDFHIRINGFRVAAFSLGALEATFKGIGTLFKAIKNAPPAIHCAMGIAGAAILINPRWRKSTITYLKNTLNISGDLLVLLMDAIEKSSATAQQKREVANRKLKKLPVHIKDELNNNGTHY